MITRFFSDEFWDYIRGKKFNEDLYLKFVHGKIFPREKFLIDHCVGKSVLHVGCVDHLPLIEQKIQDGTWLHGNICRVARECWGIDVNKEGIDWLQERGHDRLIAGDLNDPAIHSSFDGTVFDIALFGEIVEHLDNPVEFLSDFRKNYLKKVHQVIFTVPNAFRHTNVRNLFRSCEVINTDHRFWFTPYTLTKVLYSAGYDVQHIRMCTIAKSDFFKDCLLARFPLMADDIVCLASFR